MHISPFAVFVMDMLFIIKINQDSFTLSLCSIRLIHNMCSWLLIICQSCLLDFGSEPVERESKVKRYQRALTLTGSYLIFTIAA